MFEPAWTVWAAVAAGAVETAPSSALAQHAIQIQAGAHSYWNAALSFRSLEE
jgi:hypothetical protein